MRDNPHRRAAGRGRAVPAVAAAAIARASLLAEDLGDGGGDLFGPRVGQLEQPHLAGDRTLGGVQLGDHLLGQGDLLAGAGNDDDIGGLVEGDAQDVGGGGADPHVSAGRRTVDHAAGHAPGPEQLVKNVRHALGRGALELVRLQLALHKRLGVQRGQQLADSLDVVEAVGEDQALALFQRGDGPEAGDHPEHGFAGDGGVDVLQRQDNGHDFAGADLLAFIEPPQDLEAGVLCDLADLHHLEEPSAFPQDVSLHCQDDVQGV